MTDPTILPEERVAADPAVEGEVVPVPCTCPAVAGRIHHHGACRMKVAQLEVFLGGHVYARQVEDGLRIGLARAFLDRRITEARR